MKRNTQCPNMINNNYIVRNALLLPFDIVLILMRLIFLKGSLSLSHLLLFNVMLKHEAK